MIAQLHCFLILMLACTALHAQPPGRRCESTNCLHRFRESLHYWGLGPRCVAADMPIHFPYETSETYYYFRPYQGRQAFTYGTTTQAGLQRDLAPVYRRRTETTSRPNRRVDRLEYTNAVEPIPATPTRLRFQHARD